MEGPYLNLHFKFHDFFPWNNQDMEILSLGAPHAPLSSCFTITKRRKGNKEKKRNSFKAETIKKLSPRSKCYCSSYPRASTIQIFYRQSTSVADNSFQYSMTPFTLKSISRACLFEYIYRSLLFHSYYTYQFNSQSMGRPDKRKAARNSQFLG